MGREGGGDDPRNRRGRKRSRRSCLADHALLSSPPSPRRSTIPNGDQHLTTPILLKATIPSLLSLPRSPKAPITPPHIPISSSQAMTALPSFVELMASLGLDNNNNKSSSSPTQEFSSPSIVVSSEHEPIHEHISSRIRVARYSPYGAPIVSLATRPRSDCSSLQRPSQSHSHRRSASTLSSDGTDTELPTRVRSCDRGLLYTTDTPSQTTSPRHRPSALKLGPESRHRHVNDPESSANMPISTFVRRKTPTSSPVSPTFAHRTRRRSQSPTINPVSLPTLPPVFVSHIPHRSDGSSSPAESDDENSHVPRRAERLTPDYSLAEDRDVVVISSFPGNNLVQRCVSPLA